MKVLNFVVLILQEEAEDETDGVKAVVKVASVWDGKKENVKKAIYECAGKIDFKTVPTNSDFGFGSI